VWCAYHSPCFITTHTVTKFAQEKVAPLVKEMDEKEELDQSVIKGLFEQGVSFLHHTSSILTVCTLIIVLRGPLDLKMWERFIYSNRTVLVICNY